MSTVELERLNEGGVSFIDDVRVQAQQRLAQLEREAEQVRAMLTLIDRVANGHEDANGLAVPARNGNGNGHAPKASAKPNKVVRSSSGRAAKGSNKRVILSLAEQRPGITASEIAQETGIAPSVAAKTVSRLKRNGELEDHERGGVRVTRSASA